jgi:hypothetical protein
VFDVAAHILGYYAQDKSAYHGGLKNLEQLLAVLDAHLTGRTYLVSANCTCLGVTWRDVQHLMCMNCITCAGGFGSGCGQAHLPGGWRCSTSVDTATAQRPHADPCAPINATGGVLVITRRCADNSLGGVVIGFECNHAGGSCADAGRPAGRLQLHDAVRHGASRTFPLRCNQSWKFVGETMPRGSDSMIQHPKKAPHQLIAAAHVFTDGCAAVTNRCHSNRSFSTLWRSVSRHLRSTNPRNAPQQYCLPRLQHGCKGPAVYGSCTR